MPPPIQKLVLWYLSLWVRLLRFAQARPVMGTAGFVALAPILTIAGLVLGVVVSVMILAALAPIYFPAVKNLTTAFAEADTGSALANTILGIIAIVIPLALTFGFAFLVFKVSGKMGGGGKKSGY